MLLYLRLPLHIKLYVKNFTSHLKGAFSNLQIQDRTVRKLTVAGHVEVLMKAFMVREMVVSELKGTELNQVEIYAWL